MYTDVIICIYNRNYIKVTVQLFRADFPKVDHYTQSMWSIHGTKHHMGNQMQT